MNQASQVLFVVLLPGQHSHLRLWNCLVLHPVERTFLRPCLRDVVAIPPACTQPNHVSRKEEQALHRTVCHGRRMLPIGPAELEISLFRSLSIATCLPHARSSRPSSLDGSQLLSFGMLCADCWTKHTMFKRGKTSTMGVALVVPRQPQD